MTKRETFAARPSPPPWMVAELEALRAALPGYDVIITSHTPQPAIRGHPPSRRPARPVVRDQLRPR